MYSSLSSPQPLAPSPLFLRFILGWATGHEGLGRQCTPSLVATFDNHIAALGKHVRQDPLVVYRHAGWVVRLSRLLKRSQHETQTQLLGIPTHATGLHPACDPYSFVGQGLPCHRDLLDGTVVCTGVTNTGIHEVPYC